MCVCVFASARLPQAATNLLGVLVPLLKLLTSDQVRLDLPVLATMHNTLSLSALSTALQSLSAAAAADDSFVRCNSGSTMVRVQIVSRPQ